MSAKELETLVHMLQAEAYPFWPKFITHQPLPSHSAGPVSFAGRVLAPKPLEDQAIFRDPRGPAIRAKLWRLASLATVPPELLGTGTRGTAYRVDTKVLKITNDVSEAVGAALIRDTPDPLGNVQRIESVWKLQGTENVAYAVVQELLGQPEDSDPWIKFADWWPKWSRAHRYLPIIPTNVDRFIDDMETTERTHQNNRNWKAFKSWFIAVAEYLAHIGLLYHDFWHRNMLMRGTQHVAIDFGYSLSQAEPPQIRTIARHNDLMLRSGAKE